jgi:Flp pilus assembly pilin Flp
MCARGDVAGDWPLRECAGWVFEAHARAQEKVVKKLVTFTDLVTYFRARFGVEEGQTMAEYGVVLAVITALVVVALLALSGAIASALDTVRGYL